MVCKNAGVAQSSTEIYNKILMLEKQGSKNEKDIGMIFTAIKELYGFQEKESSKRIGFWKVVSGLENTFPS